MEIQPKELQFIFELKKQSTCAVRLTNNTYHNVAFKVKTTSPKKYCVRPNVGVISPKSTCEFTVTMQAPKAVPVDMVCKDKFLIQSTVVPIGTTDNDITPNMFSRDDGKHFEEVKLRVAFMSPPESPVLSPINGVLNQGPFFEPPVLRDPGLNKFENSTPPHPAAENVEIRKIYNWESEMEKNVELKSKKNDTDFLESKPAKDTDFMSISDTVSLEELRYEELKPEKVATSVKLAKAPESPPPIIRVKDAVIDKLEKELEFAPQVNPVIGVTNVRSGNDSELPLAKNAVKDALDEKLAKEIDVLVPENDDKDEDFVVVKPTNELKIVSDIEEMKSKLNVLESKLNEAESTISKLTEERRLSIQERQSLQEELAVLRSRTIKKVQVGFPLLFVVMVALISIFLGYISQC